MKKIMVAAAVLVLLALPSVALAADEPAKYSFASAQGASNLQAIPGTEVQGVVYFYNVDGNRITHIKLDILQSPDGWTVEIDPPLAEQGYDLTGDGVVDVTVMENLFVEPSTVSDTTITNVPKGSISLTLPNKLGTDVPGYALAKVIKFNITVPKSEVVGTNGSIKILATGSWLGQSGAAAIAQTREFDYSIQTVYELSEEKPVTAGGDGFNFGLWLPIAGGVVVVILIIILLPRFVDIRRKQG